MKHSIISLLLLFLICWIFDYVYFCSLAQDPKTCSHGPWNMKHKECITSDYYHQQKLVQLVIHENRALFFIIITSVSLTFTHVCTQFLMNTWSIALHWAWNQNKSRWNENYTTLVSFYDIMKCGWLLVLHEPYFNHTIDTNNNSNNNNKSASSICMFNIQWESDLDFITLAAFFDDDVNEIFGSQTFQFYL